MICRDKRHGEGFLVSLSESHRRSAGFVFIISRLEGDKPRVHLTGDKQINQTRVADLKPL